MSLIAPCQMGLHNSVRGFRWAYKQGGTGGLIISGIKKPLKMSYGASGVDEISYLNITINPIR